MTWPTLNKLIGAAALACAAQGAAHATTVKDACFATSDDIGTITNALKSQGWSNVDPDRALDDMDVLNHLTWMGMPQYFAGDSGGASLQAVLSMKSMSARGLLRKKDIPSAKTRVLKRSHADQTEVATITFLQATEHVTDIRCAFSLSAATLRSHWSEPSDFALTEDFTRYFVTAPERQEAKTALNIVRLDTAALSKTLDKTVPTQAIVETYLTFSRQKD